MYKLLIMSTDVSSNITTQIVKLKKKKRPRCNFKYNEETCKKKLKLVDTTIVCKCNKTFCYNHRSMINHHCEFYKLKIEEKKDNIMKNLGGGNSKQIEVI